MAFTNRQARALRAKLAHKHVKSRSNNGTPIAYVEGWHVISEANRIFGFDAWDRTTLSPTCVWSELQRGQTVCFYSTRVRIRVRAGDIVVMRDGIGTGIGRAASPEQAHEIALKAAETDATKRALATFGNPFGLALYDKEQTGVTKPLSPKTEGVSSERSEYTLVVDGRVSTFPTTARLKATVLDAIPKLASIEALYGFWEANVATLSRLRQEANGADVDPVADILEALKGRARDLGLPPKSNGVKQKAEAEQLADAAPMRLAIPKERRVRDKNHLAFVAKHSCVICGRHPVHAHHLRFAQPRAMAMKVSDEFTVPLCAIHHDELHRTGDERAWWARHGIIEPLKLAARLWDASQQGEATDPISLDSTDTSPPALPKSDGPSPNPAQ